MNLDMGLDMNLDMNMNIGTSYCFDDILIEPLFSNIETRNAISLETNIGTNGRKLLLKTPLISSPMDTVTETQMAIKMALNGGLGIIHRFMDIDTQVAQIIKVKRFLQYIIQEPYKITEHTTLAEIEVFRELYNVSSFCVIDNIENNKLLGIITRRDIEYMKQCDLQKCNLSNLSNKDENISHDIETQIPDIQNNNIYEPMSLKTNEFMTYINNIVCIDMMQIMKYTLDATLKLAKDLMIKNKIEKIPIINSNSNGNGNILVGLITLKNIRHYEDNKFKACIDANGALCVGAAIGIVDDYINRLDRLVFAGVDLICIDVANGFNSNVYDAIKLIRSKYPNLVIMAGNVCNWQGYSALANYDVDCIRVGVGNGSICTTRLETGIGKGQFSAVAECVRYKNNYIKNNEKLNGITNATNATNAKTQQLPNIICDGGSLGKTGNKVKALACGASAVMLGRTLASTEESPGIIIYRNGKRFKYIRGMASTMANLSKQEKIGNGSGNGNKTSLKTKFTAEGVDGEQELSGSVVDVIEQINGGLKSGFSYLGCLNINELHVKNAKGEIKYNLVTSIGMSENGIRVKTY